MRKPKLLVYDIETAGVNALNADLGYIITFGYIWLDDFEKGKKWKTISIGDFKGFEKDPHNDKEIVKEALKILGQADGIIHHYGNKFDAPYILTRALIHKLDSFPDVPMLDTCFLAYKRLKLSSNRLVNVAKVLKCKWQKLDKKDGWPKWWMSYLKGSLKHDKPMREYCGIDVMTLAEISIRMRPYWPKAFTNRLFEKKSTVYCESCGSDNLVKDGIHVRNRKLQQRYRCMNCKNRSIYGAIEE